MFNFAVLLCCKIRTMFEYTRQTHDDRTIYHVDTLGGLVFCQAKAAGQLYDSRKMPRDFPLFQ